MANLATSRVTLLGPEPDVEQFIDDVRSEAPGPNWTFVKQVELRAARRIVDGGEDPEDVDDEIAARIRAAGVTPRFRAARFERMDTDVRFPETLIVPPDIACDNPEVVRDRSVRWAHKVQREVDELPKSRSAGDPTAFDLNRMSPVPGWVSGLSYPMVGREWCLQNWGTKANAALPYEDYPDLIPTRNGDFQAIYTNIKTANSGPLEAIRAGSKRFPRIQFQVASIEPANEYAEAACYQNGETFGYVDYRESVPAEWFVHSETNGTLTVDEGVALGNLLEDIDRRIAELKTGNTPGL